MHRPGIARVDSDKIILDGTTIEEVKQYHRDTLILCVEKTNEEEKQIRKREEQLKRKKQEERENHYRNIDDISKDIAKATTFSIASDSSTSLNSRSPLMATVIPVFERAPFST